MEPHTPHPTPTFHAMACPVSGIAPEVLAAQREINAMLAQLPESDVRTPEGLAEHRSQVQGAPGILGLGPSDVQIAGPVGAMRLRLFVPPAPVRAVMLQIHGGGFVAGAPELDDVFNDQIALAGAIAVVSPAYRLAPEASIEDQIEDCVAAAVWTASEATSRFGTDVLMIAGTSAGAHLALAAMLRLRELGNPAFAHVAGAHLDCGPYDLSFTPSVRIANEHTLILTQARLSAFIELGLPGVGPEERRRPSLSPLYADLTNLPPALFTVGELDPLRDDTLFLSARWQQAGNHAELDVWPEAAHAFSNMPTPMTELALARKITWIDCTLSNTEKRAAATS